MFLKTFYITVKQRHTIYSTLEENMISKFEITLFLEIYLPFFEIYCICGNLD